ncbi:MAG TPA: hypothetical protein VMU49_01365 [Candidatus Acidoferrales bacterium]|nr:hypothetical protein [Candidatus Acidoferrales bacterium]
MEVHDGHRHGPADLDHPPPGGSLEPILAGDVLVGWCPAPAPRHAAKRAREEAGRIHFERRAYLLGRLGHKLRSSVLALQESARQAAFGHDQLLHQIYDQAQEVGRRAAALESVALDPKDDPRSVVIGAVINLAAPEARTSLPGNAVVRVAETVLVDALTRTYEWMGGPGVAISVEPSGPWWRVGYTASASPGPMAAPELGEPLVRLLVESRLEGWLEVIDSTRVAIFLPAATL